MVNRTKATITMRYVIALLLVFFFLIPSFDIKLTPSDLLGDLLAEQSDGTYKKNYDEHGKYDGI